MEDTLGSITLDFNKEIILILDYELMPKDFSVGALKTLINWAYNGIKRQDCPCKIWVASPTGGHWNLA